MRILVIGALALALAVTGCTTVPLAPGADQVKITRNEADVAFCKPVGNIDRKSILIDWDPKVAARQMQNQAVGLGGNVIFDTSIRDTPMGVVYHCGDNPAGNK